MPDFFYQLNFYLFSLVAIAAAIAFVTRRSPVAAALWLVVVLFCLAALYVMLNAQFIGVIQVLVYAGAIMVVFLFVVMLLNLGHVADLGEMRGKWGRLAAGLVGLGLLAQLFVVVRARTVPALVQSPSVAAQEMQDYGVIGTVARPLFNEYLLAFELTSILLLVAVVGAVVLGRRRAA